MRTSSRGRVQYAMVSRRFVEGGEVEGWRMGARLRGAYRAFARSRAGLASLSPAKGQFCRRRAAAAACASTSMCARRRQMRQVQATQNAPWARGCAGVGTCRGRHARCGACARPAAGSAVGRAGFQSAAAADGALPRRRIAA